MEHFVRLSIFLFLIGFGEQLNGQHTYPIRAFSPIDYKALPQNWSIATSDKNQVYIANSGGILHFNGVRWQLLNTPDGLEPRSIKTVNGRIYVGMYGELGYFKLASCGEYSYHSLNGLIEDPLFSKEEIWHIEHIGDKVYFQSFAMLFEYNGKSMKRVSLPGAIMFLQDIGKRKWIQVIDQGLFSLEENDKVVKVEGSEVFNNKIVTGIEALSNNRVLISTSKNGLYIYQNGQFSPWNTKIISRYTGNNINKLLVSKDGKIVLGTISNGLVILDPNGSLMAHYDASKGLPNNTVLSLHQSSNDVLWVGLDRGLACINLSADYLEFVDFNGKFGTPYCAKPMSQGGLLLGTNQGLYRSVGTGDFKLVNGSQGQVWHLTDTPLGILVGHNEGSFLLKNERLTKISKHTGGWSAAYVPKQVGNVSTILQGSYTGLVKYQFSHGNVSVNKIKGFSEPVNQVIYDANGQLWISSPNVGIRKCSLDLNRDTLIFLGQVLQGIPRGHGTLMYVESDTLFAMTSQYKWQIRNDKIEKIQDVSRNDSKRALSPFQMLRPSLLGQDKLISLKPNGYVVSKQNTYSAQNDGSFNIEFILASGANCLSITDKTLKLDYDQRNIDVFLNSDKLFENGDKRYLLALGNERPSNNLSFIPLIDGKISLKNTQPGKYTLWMENSNTPLLYLDIARPWYQSYWFYGLIFTLFSVFVFQLNKYYLKQIDIQRAKLEAENNRLKREHEIELENQRLAQENIFKNMELANASMHLMQKNAVLEEIKEELIDLKNSNATSLTGKEVQDIMKRINQNITVDDDKQLFETSFDEIHGAFIKALKKNHPNLSHEDLKLAAFIKMNMPSKDLAPIFNLSIRGLENKRYRLRKKMGLSNDVNILVYLENFN